MQAAQPGHVSKNLEADAAASWSEAGAAAAALVLEPHQTTLPPAKLEEDQKERWQQRNEDDEDKEKDEDKGDKDTEDKGSKEDEDAEEEASLECAEVGPLSLL